MITTFKFKFYFFLYILLLTYSTPIQLLYLAYLLKQNFFNVFIVKINSCQFISKRGEVHQMTFHCIVFSTAFEHIIISMAIKLMALPNLYNNQYTHWSSQHPIRVSLSFINKYRVPPISGKCTYRRVNTTWKKLCFFK